MDIDFLKTVLRCHLKQCVKVGIVRMHSAVGKEAHKMQGVPFLCVLHGGGKVFVLKEASVFYLVAYP